jgi:putative sporulation protein YtaF
MKFLFVVALSAALGLDALASGVAYGLKKIDMPLRSLGIIGLVTVVATGFAMVGGALAGGLLDLRMATVVGASLMMLLGIYRLLTDFLTRDTALSEHGHPRMRPRLSFSVGTLVIRIMAKPEAADMDQSKHISSGEAMFLGMALGVDNMVAASAASLGQGLPIYTPLVMGVFQVGLISIGVFGAAWLVDHRVRFRFLYLSGTVLVALGLLRLV